MYKYLWLVVSIALISVLIVWSPFWLRLNNFWGIDFSGKSMLTIAQNYDALNFLVVSRSWYDPGVIEQNYSALVNERGSRYFAAHYPGYASLIWFFDQMLNGVQAIFASIIVSNVLLGIMLVIFYKEYLKQRNLIIPLATLALFFPPRMMPLRAVGSSELLCLFLVLLSLVFYHRREHGKSAVVGALAVLTRSPAILLFGAYFIDIIYTNINNYKEALKRVLPYLLMPLSLLVLFGYFGYIYGDVLAYFRVGGNINLYLPPFLAAGANLPWVAGYWREDIIYVYIINLVGATILWQKVGGIPKLRIVAIFVSIYTILLLFVAHRDVARYSMLIAPMLLLGYGPHLVKIRNYWILAILLIPLILYTWNFILGNIQPIADWSPLL